jgi:hypothetical protein
MKSLREVCAGPFAKWLGEDDWTAWLSFLSALRGEPMSPNEARIYRECTGRTSLPTQPFKQAWVIAARRGRKSAIGAVIACYLSVYHKWKRAPGESVRVLIVAVSKDQASLVKDYCQAILESRPGLKRLIQASDSSSITLSTGVTIVSVANSFRSIRGPTVVCAIFDELSFWRSDDSANPDTEVLRAVSPAMLTAPGSILVGLSSPYAKKGLLFEKFRDHYSHDDPRVLVWKAPTERMNPQVDSEAIREEYLRDPASAAAEFGADFRNDLESYVSREALDAVTVPGRYELPPIAGVHHIGAVDPSTGSGQDSWTFSISYVNKEGIGILSLLREWKPPFSPEAVVDEIVALCNTYGIRRITGDRFGGMLVEELFKKRGVSYATAEKPKSEFYHELLPLINSGKVELLDHHVLHAQALNLECRNARSGKPSIDHARGAHDDIINVCAIGLVLCAGKSNVLEAWERFGRSLGPATNTHQARPGVVWGWNDLSGIPQSAVLYAQGAYRGHRW